MNRLVGVLWLFGVACGGAPGGDLGDDKGLGGDEWTLDVQMGDTRDNMESSAPVVGDIDSCNGSTPSLTAEALEDGILVTHTGVPSRWCRTVTVTGEQTDDHEVTMTYEPSGDDCDPNGCTVTLMYTLVAPPPGSWTILALDESVVVDVP